MESSSTDDADVLVLIDEIGIPRSDKEVLITGFRDRIGMQFEERYGTLAFSGPIDVLASISDAVAEFINRYQLVGKIFPVIRRETIDQEFRDRLLRYAVFQRFWEVEDEKAVILTYDISHKQGRSGKRYYTLQEVGALKVFQSCYWIPEERIEYVTRKFNELVMDSRNRSENVREIDYHFRVFKCYPIGSPDGLKRWKDLQLSLFMNKMNTLLARTRGKASYFAYARTVFDVVPDAEREALFKKIKRMRYWKHVAKKELEPYRDAHLRRMRTMGIASQSVNEEVQVDMYNTEGEVIKTHETISHTIEQAMEELTNALQTLHEEVYDFIAMINERNRAQTNTPTAT
jgi:hypothetical protein